MTAVVVGIAEQVAEDLIALNPSTKTEVKNNITVTITTELPAGGNLTLTNELYIFCHKVSLLSSISYLRYYDIIRLYICMIFFAECHICFVRFVRKRPQNMLLRLHVQHLKFFNHFSNTASIFNLNVPLNMH